MSFNYELAQDFSLFEVGFNSDLIAKLEDMSAWLSDNGEPEAAAILGEYVGKLKAAIPDYRLLPVIQAAERWAGDYSGRDQLATALEKYKELLEKEKQS